MSTGESLFAYGTLMFAPVFAAVCGENLSAEPAVLHGYARYRVRAAVYPAMIARIGARTRGVVYSELSPSNWHRLDFFEGDIYERINVQIKLDSGLSRLAWTYVIAPRHDSLLSSERWSARRFASQHLASYLHNLDS